MSKKAFVTFLMRNDSFLPGALVCAYGLRKQNVEEDLVCLVTKEITKDAREVLKIIYDEVIEIAEIFFEHKHRHQRQDRPFLFTRFNVLRLGRDGDLGYDYDKICMIDADIIPIRKYSELFNLNTPAGIVNESKDYVMEFDENLQYVSRGEGKWKWHSIYDPICKHGETIPQEITERVKTDPSNMGVNACLWVLTPSMDDFESILDSTQLEENSRLLTESFNWPEMQYATMYYSGRWTNIDLKYATFKGYPNLDVVYGTHFSGVKPWNFKKEKTLKNFVRYADFQLWYRMYFDMLNTYPNMRDLKRLVRLEDNIKRLLDSVEI
jgi:glycogenin glucosyltransferase